MAIPYRNLMPPPNLTGDTPIADIFKPVEINFRPTFGNELNSAVLRCFDCGFGKRLHPDKPLLRKIWLHHRVATGTVADGMDMRLFFDKQPGFFKIFNHSLSRFKPVEAAIV